MTPPLESMVPTFGGESPSRRASGALDVSQAEPLPFPDSTNAQSGAPATVPEARRGRAAQIGIRLTALLLIATGAGVFAAWEIRTFGFEAYLFHSTSRDAAFQVQPGPASWDLSA